MRHLVHSERGEETSKTYRAEDWYGFNSESYLRFFRSFEKIAEGRGQEDACDVIGEGDSDPVARASTSMGAYHRV